MTHVQFIALLTRTQLRLHETAKLLVPSDAPHEIVNGLRMAKVQVAYALTDLDTLLKEIEE